MTQSNSTADPSESESTSLRTTRAVHVGEVGIMPSQRGESSSQTELNSPIGSASIPANSDVSLGSGCPSSNSGGVFGSTFKKRGKRLKMLRRSSWAAEGDASNLPAANRVETRMALGSPPMGSSTRYSYDDRRLRRCNSVESGFKVSGENGDVSVGQNRPRRFSTLISGGRSRASSAPPSPLAYLMRKLPPSPKSSEREPYQERANFPDETVSSQSFSRRASQADITIGKEPLERGGVMQNLPPTMYKQMAMEQQARVQVLNFISLFLEDFAEVEANIGKLLSKVPQVNPQPKSMDWLPAYSSSMEALCHASTISIGQQQLRLSSIITQQVNNSLPEQYHLMRRRISTLVSQVTAIQEELRRGKVSQKKGEERYLKLVQEVECLMQQRLDIPPLSSEHDPLHSPIGGVPSGSVSFPSGDTGGGSSMSGSVDMSSPSFPPSNPTGSFARMFKLSSERTPFEKIAELVPTINQVESSLATDAMRLSRLRESLLEDINAAYEEHELLETQRLAILRDALRTLLSALQGMVTQRREMQNNLRQCSEEVRVEAEIARLRKRIEILSDTSHNSQSLVFLVPIDLDNVPSLNYGGSGETLCRAMEAVRVVVSRAEMLKDIMEQFQDSVRALCTALQAAIDIQMGQAKSLRKALERHGFRVGIWRLDFTGGGPGVGGSSGHICKTITLEEMDNGVNLPCVYLTSEGGSQLCGAALRDVELPRTRAAWEGLLRALNALLDVQQANMAFTLDASIQQLTQIDRRLSVERRVLADQVSAATKRLQVAYSLWEKFSAKLKKIRVTLAERRATVAGLRQSVYPVGSTQRLSSSEDETYFTMATSDGFGSAGSTSGAVGSSGGSSTGGGLMSLKHTLESIGSSLAGVKLKQVVGLERPAERLSRIEAQIANLEAEERDASESLEASRTALDAALAAARLQVETDFNNSTDQFSVDLETMEGLLSSYLSHQEEVISVLCRQTEVLYALEERLDEFEDLSVATQTLGRMSTAAVQVAGGGNLSAQLFIIPAVESFTPVQSEILEEARWSLSYHQILGSSRMSSGGQPSRGESLSLKESEESGLIPDNLSDPAIGIFSHAEAKTDEGTMNQIDSPSYRLTNARDSPQQRMTVVPPANADLRKFGLDGQHRVLEKFTCALYPKGGLPSQGRLYITQHFLAFAGWPETRLLLRLADIVSVERSTTLRYLPNALTVKTSDGAEHFFGSLLERETAFQTLSGLSEVARHLKTLGTAASGAAIAEETGFGLGYQTIVAAPAVFRSNSTTSVVNGNAKRNGETKLLSGSGDQLDQDTPADGSGVKLLAPLSLTEEEAPIDYVPGAVTTVTNNKTFLPLLDTVLPCGVNDILVNLWQSSSAYIDFLDSEGDLDLTSTEWRERILKDGPVLEDPCQLSFQFIRDVSYRHPRTSMLMFGPSHAPAQQKQYLLLTGKDDIPPTISIDQLTTRRVTGAVLLLVTQFDGIPMADVFRVAQYWTLASNPEGGVRITISLHMHYLKSSMWKSQIVAGTKEELTPSLARWINFARGRLFVSTGSRKRTDSIDSHSATGTSDVPNETNLGSPAGKERTSKPIQYFFLNIQWLSWIAVFVLLIVILAQWRDMSALRHELRNLKTIPTDEELV